MARKRGTPIRSLYRIYEAIAAREYVVIGPEVEYFLSSIAGEFANAFNWRMSLGMRRDKESIFSVRRLMRCFPPFPPETAPT